ncbi:hypothetical protein AVEN_16789-1 [Araneus ventricosus]|uniref:Uncharacterized protein n=1 Tax=Araneus ventricosus TaxID=182803 RepID=A0A4Y2BPW3_ARAVE|nr:hypothetical protein AVEN_16789-1 [Araneus ventricosus]
MSGERGGQGTCPQPPTYLLGYVASRWLRTAIEKCAGAPSCMNHMFWSTVAGIPCSKSGRTCCRKTRYFAPLRRSGRRYGPNR